MTDRIRYLTVVLDQDYRVDDAESIIDAMHMMKGVSGVLPGEAVSGNDHINRGLIYAQIRSDLIDALYKMEKKA